MDMVAHVSTEVAEAPLLVAHEDEPGGVELYRAMLEQDRYRAAIALVESYPWPDLAAAVRGEWMRGRHSVAARYAGSVRIGETEWWVDPNTVEVYPFLTEMALCAECIGEGRWTDPSVEDARARGRLDMYAHSDCRFCGGSGEVEDLISLRDAWDGNQLYVADDPLVTAMQLVTKHYLRLPEQFRADVELAWPALERPAQFQGSGS